MLLTAVSQNFRWYSFLQIGKNNIYISTTNFQESVTP